jgi:hypothetical protein
LLERKRFNAIIYDYVKGDEKMTYKIIVQAHLECKENEIIGAKEGIAEIFERIGCGVDYINVMPGEVKND